MRRSPCRSIEPSVLHSNVMTAQYGWASYWTISAISANARLTWFALAWW
jgi:hypothetical protein